MLGRLDGSRGQKGLLRQSRICRNRLGVRRTNGGAVLKTYIKEPAAISLNKRICRAYHSKVFILLLFLPLIAPLRVIPYSYVPTKQRPSNNGNASALTSILVHITSHSKTS
jgi:hypothetical protein